MVEAAADAKRNGRRKRPLQISNVPLRRGFTLVEAAMCTLIVGVMLVAALQMVGVSVRARQVTAQLTQDNNLAVSLLSEILQARYSEPGEIAIVESVDQQLCGYVAHFSLQTISVTANQWWGETFRPALPADAISWKLDRVMVHLRQFGAASGDTRIQVRSAGADNLPTGAPLGEVVVPESSLPPAGGVFTWWNANFDIAGLAPTQGVCLLMITTDAAGSAETYHLAGPIHDHPEGVQLRSLDGGGSWQIATDEALRYMAYGTYSTPDENATPFGLESPETSTTRADYDDVDDYDNWSASPPEDRDGNALNGYASWTRAANVEYVDPADPNGASVNTDSGLKRITITVTDPESRKRAMVGFRSKTGAYEEEITLTKTYTSWVGIEVQFGDDVPVFVGTDLLNEPVLVVP